MNAEMKLKLTALLREDAEINKEVESHNLKVQAFFAEESKALQHRANVHNEKVAEYLRELGIKQKGTLLDIVGTIANSGND